jgi:hypothetical protein
MTGRRLYQGSGKGGVMAVIGPVARYLLLTLVLVGSPAILLWSLTAAFRTPPGVEAELPVLVGAKRALKVRLARGDLTPAEHEYIRGLIRSLPLRTRLRARVTMGTPRLFWIAWCVGWALFWALVEPQHSLVALVLAPLSVAAAFLPLGRAKPTGDTHSERS